MARTTMQQRMLGALRPADLEGEPERWQQQKSTRTRLRIIEAAIACLLEGGYVGLTTHRIAARIGISRGAMQHHFPARADLVAAVVEHVFYARMRLFLDDYLSGMAKAGEDNLVEIATQAHWRSVQSPEYAAYVELAVAARSDEALREVFEPAARRYDEVWVSEMIESFPQWRARWEAMKLASDLVTCAHMGMLLQRPTFGEARIEQLNTLIWDVLRGLYKA
ncbi:TetR/AcrR family transcriptional regulator [Novosphingobium olei]|uniref:TetR/AcrR family transcriptional regulator n=1 Tax=Novosphingobium olei TaxID=2728851 RepID=A0A7Y0G9D8_9SPHN|nr:TetR/AcrR family transcriptional regulator [Novosphingobium olei]NML92542.1 TetR/AcrR family transcriptional regulator [Novosphingobium olei]BEV01601.1 TetR/AcrR family transcriptional regulator [Novosphingobium olei]